jgi:hypothetical protein
LVKSPNFNKKKNAPDRSCQHFLAFKSIKMKNTIACFLTLFMIGCNGNNYRPELTAAGLRGIKLGMKLEEVEKLIGVPYEVSAQGSVHDMTCKNASKQSASIRSYDQLNKIIQLWKQDTSWCCEANKEDKKIRNGYTLDFTKHFYLNAADYPMVWVHLDSNLSVIQVYAKLYEGFLGFDYTEIYTLSEYGHNEHPKFLTAFH